MNQSAAQLSAATEKLLNEQIYKERAAETVYLSMAVWADCHAYPGVAQFFYYQADGERAHMMKIIRYLVELGRQPLVPASAAPLEAYSSLHQVLQKALEHETMITRAIYRLVDQALSCKEFGTFQFLQWFVAEQREEEVITRRALEIFETIGEEGVGRYKIDEAIKELRKLPIA